MQINDSTKATVFKSEGLYKSDSILKSSKNINISSFKKKQSSFNNSIYYNYSTNTLIENGYIGSEKIEYELKEFKISWTLLNENKMINNFSVYKAECLLFGRLWTAWYTTEIPFQVGPYKFNGLPGLILEITDSKNEYSFSILEVSRQKLDAMNFSNFKSVNYEFFRKLKNNLKNNPYSSIPNFDLLEGSVKDKILEQFKIQQKLNNNPL